MKRYAVIHEKFPREFVLLQGRGCRWAKCLYCDYHADVSSSPYETNLPVLQQVTGCYGVLDVINSGSAPELDADTLRLIRETVQARGIHTLWFEAHYIYRHRLEDFARQFAPAQVKFRCGIESFDGALRERLRKGISAEVRPDDVARYFKGVCLLCGMEGDTRERILSDIAIARRHFEYASVNLFCPNSTPVKRDDELCQWFLDEVYPALKDDTNFEVLVENTDLGVG